MHGEHLEPNVARLRRSGHVALRANGATVRQAVDAWLALHPRVSRRELVTRLARSLERRGGAAPHLRTLHRYLSGGIETVPAEVTAALEGLVALDLSRDEAEFVPWESVKPLVEAWLARDPSRTKRALARALAERMRATGSPMTVDHLQVLLGGRHGAVRRAVVEQLRVLAPDLPLAPSVSAFDARALEDAAPVVVLVADVRRRRGPISGRRLAALLAPLVRERGVEMSEGQLERALNGRTTQVRRAVRLALESLLRASAPPAPPDSERRPRDPELEARVREHLPLVRKIARGFRRYGLDEEDLVQEGTVGLVIAVRRFDPSRGARLSTYASFWIRAMLFDFVFKQKGVVRFGRRQHSRLFFGLRRAEARLESQLGDRERVEQELARQFDVDADEIRLSLSRLWARDVSLDAEGPEGGHPRVELLPDLADGPEEAFARAEHASRVRRRLRAVEARLDARQRAILEKRWMSDGDVTLAELGAEWGVTRERIRQVERRLASELREALAGVAYADAG